MPADAQQPEMLQDSHGQAIEMIGNVTVVYTVTLPD